MRYAAKNYSDVSMTGMLRDPENDRPARRTIASACAEAHRLESLRGNPVAMPEILEHGVRPRLRRVELGTARERVPRYVAAAPDLDTDEQDLVVRREQVGDGRELIASGLVGQALRLQ